MLEILDLAAKLPQALGTTGAEMAGQLPQLAKELSGQSIVERSLAARNVTRCIIDGMLANDPNLTTLLRFVNQQIAVMWLQSLQLMMAHNDVQIAQILDSLNPDRDLTLASTSALGGLYAGGNNEYDVSDYSGFKMPRPWVNKPEFDVVPETKSKFDAYVTDTRYAGGNNAFVPPKPEDDPDTLSNSLHKDTVNQLQTMNNIAIGQIIDVTFQSKNGKYIVPIQIQLSCLRASSDAISTIMAYAEQDRSLPERFWQWKNKLITTGQFITGSDLVDKHVQMLRKDKTGIYAETIKRQRRNKTAGFLSVLNALSRGLGNANIAGTAGVASTQIYVIDKVTADQIDLEIGGSFRNDFRLRSRIFVNTCIMMLVVYDPSLKIVNIYYRGMEKPATLDIDDIKPLTKNQGGNEVMQMLQAYQSGKMMGQPSY